MGKPQLQVLFVLEYYYPHVGGVETLFHSLVEGLQESGVQCTILTQRFQPDLPARERTVSGAFVRRIRVPNRYIFTFIAFFHALRLARKADVLHTTSYNAALPAFFAGALFRRPVIITFHEAWGKLWFRLPFQHRLSARGHYLFEQLLLKLPFRYFIGVSRATSRRLAEEGVPDERIRTIYNGLDYSGYPSPAGSQPSVPPPNFTYTYFGRIGLSKGLDQLLPAAKKLAMAYPESTLQLIVPDQPAAMRQWLQETVERLELTSQVRIRSSLSKVELEEAIRASDWVVIPSYSEGFCFAAAEVVALGVPIVHSGQGALPEVVSGYYVEAGGPDHQSLFEGLEKAAVGSWTHRPFRPFPLSDSVAAYQALYQTLFSQQVMHTGPEKDTNL